MAIVTAILILLLFSSVPAGHNQDCTPFPGAPTCGCSLSDGKTIDLRSLGDLSGRPAFTINGGLYNYSYNPCYPFTSAHGCTDAAICQLQVIDGLDFSLGIQKDVNFQMVDNNTVITYTGGYKGRTSEVTVICAAVAPKLVFDKEDPILYYRFTLTSLCGCPGACSAEGIDGN